MGSVTGDGSRGQEDEAVSGGGDHGRDHRAGGGHGGDHGDGSWPPGPLLRPRQGRLAAGSPGLMRPGRGRSYSRPAPTYVEE